MRCRLGLTAIDPAHLDDIAGGDRRSYEWCLWRAENLTGWVPRWLGGDPKQAQHDARAACHVGAIVDGIERPKFPF